VIGGLTAIQSRVNELQSLVGANPVTAAMRAGAAGATGAAASGAAGAASSGSSALGGAAGGATPFDDLIAKLKESGDGKPAEAKPGTAKGTSAADQVIKIAKKYLGIPYLWGGTNPDKGLDCSGLVQLVYKQVGVDLPRVSRDQARAGTKVDSLKQAKPGDLVFFHSPVSHVGIYLGDGMMLDAPKTGDKVKIQKVWATPSHIRRVLPQASSAAATSAVRSTSSVAGPSHVAGASSGSKLSGPYADLFTAAGRKYGVDPALLSAVAKNESGYRPNAVSHAGARGLMQIMPATARGLGIDPLDPKQAVDGAARLLSGYLDDYDGSVKLALAAYNAGPGAVKRHGGVPPYHETQTYISRVTSTWKDLR
jgi:cell wall-associated NlpC family hydrolase